MKRKVVWTLFLVATLLLGLAALAPAISGGDPRNPTLFEKRAQAYQIAVPFPVDPEIARQWVPPEFQLVIDAQGKATGVFAIISSQDFSLYRTPNSPPLKGGENFAPDSVAHFWFLIQGPYQILQVPGAQATAPTAYYYDVADLVSNPVAHRLYLRAGRPAIFVSSITLVDGAPVNGTTTQTGEVTFRDGSKISLVSTTTLRAVPLKLGGNVWQYHVGGLGEMGNDLGVRLDPETGNPSNVSTTHGQYLGLTPGNPSSSAVTISADPGTYFEDIFGMASAVSTKGTFFKPNNLVLNASRGDLWWIDFPSPLIPPPPAVPAP
jgi:hypothetical protein